MNERMMFLIEDISFFVVFVMINNNQLRKNENYMVINGDMYAIVLINKEYHLFLEKIPLFIY